MATGKYHDPLFREAMRDVEPLKAPERAVQHGTRPDASARQTRAARRALLNETLNATLRESPAGEAELVRQGIGEPTMHRLRRGRFSIEAELDLHGLTRAEALTALKAFLVDATFARLGCVRIIHGKGSRSGPGGPVLKHAVQEWLAHWDAVLAFTSAQPRHGGNGAVYVLLKQR